MRLTKLIWAAAAGLALTGQVFAETYKIDASHSSVGFSVRHMVVTNTKGVFRDFEGAIQYDPKDVTKSSVKVTIKAASIDTGNEARDKHLRTGDFFDAEQFPEITFESRKIEKGGSGYLATGDLTIRGVTQSVQIPFQLAGPVTDPWQNVRIGAEGGLEINRQDYGVSWNTALDNGGVVVGDIVKIDLVVEGIRVDAPKEKPKMKKKS